MTELSRTLSEHRSFGGTQGFYEHASREIGLPMRFSVYLPPQAATARVPALIYLAGLTCNEETFMVKAGAQRLAAELGVALVAPDTSPRGANVEGESANWDFGVGAGFYLDATQAPWATNWRLESWLMKELLPLVAQQFPVDADRLGIFGHSMGGHGALTLALRYPGVFKSLSAFAPICAPTQCPWGHKAFTGYLGADTTAWIEHDATVLMQHQPVAPYPAGILVDQGLADKFLAEQLHPHLFEEACHAIGQPLTLRRHEGYDHGYYFIQSFMADHLAHHANALNRLPTPLTLAADARLRDIGFAPQPQLAGIWRRGWAVGHPTPALEPIARLARVQAEFRAPTEVVVIERRDQPLAFMALHRTRGYVAQLFVEPHLRAHGFGRELLDEARVRMPAGWKLHVATANLQAQRFYDRYGLERGDIDRHPATGRERVAYHWRQARP